MSKFVNKGVSFNLSDIDQRKLYEHAMKRTNFSSYVKRLIQRDMEGSSLSKLNDTNPVQTTPDPANFNSDLMNGLL